MKIYLASFMEPLNFGPGRLIGVIPPCNYDPITGEASSNKPNTLEVNWLYPQFTPSEEILKLYKETKQLSFKDARHAFNAAYDQQLRDFCEAVERDAEMQGKKPEDLLELKDGDTLCSWERRDRTHYRNLLGGWLEYLGYEVSYA